MPRPAWMRRESARHPARAPRPASTSRPLEAARRLALAGSPAWSPDAGSEEWLARQVAAAKEGDRAAYEAIVRALTPELQRQATRQLGGADTPDDVVQLAFVKAFEQLHTVEGRIDAWLYRIVQNACIDIRKSARQRNHEPYETDVLESGALPPDRALELTELGERLAWALEQLPAMMREAFLLKHVEGLSYPEMADALGSSVSALKMRVMRAREALQEMLGPLAADYTD